MKTETFNSLLSNLKRDTGDTDLSLGMIAKWQTYELNVYCEDAGIMQVECTDKDKEIQLDGTQLWQIEKIFNAELYEIEVNIKNENAIGFTDDYESSGHKQSNFY